MIPFLGKTGSRSRKVPEKLRKRCKIMLLRDVKALYTNTPPKVKQPCSRMHLKQQGLFTKVQNRGAMMNERVTTQGLGHQVSGIVG